MIQSLVCSCGEGTHSGLFQFSHMETGGKRGKKQHTCKRDKGEQKALVKSGCCRQWAGEGGGSWAGGWGNPTDCTTSRQWTLRGRVGTRCRLYPLQTVFRPNATVCVSGQTGWRRSSGSCPALGGGSRRERQQPKEKGSQGKEINKNIYPFNFFS